MLKKMSRFIAVNIILVMTLAACGGSDNSSQSADSGSQTVVEEQSGENTPPVDQTSDDAGTEDSGQTAAEISEEDEETLKIKYTEMIFTAFQNLDAETLKPFLEEDDYTEIAEFFDHVKDTPGDLEFWDNTIGSMIYLTDSDLLLQRSSYYVAAKWYTDCWKSNEEIPGKDSKDFSIEYLDEIYSNYYVDAPCIIINGLHGFSGEIVHLSEEGTARTRLSYIKDTIRCGQLDFKNYDSGLLRSAIIMNNDGFYSFGYDYLMEDIPGYEALLSNDIDAMVELAEAASDYERGSIKDYIEKYYKSEEYKPILQQYMNENCEMLRDVDTVVVFLTVDIDKIFPYSFSLTQEDKERLKEMNVRIVEWHYIGSFSENMSNNFTAYRDIIDHAKKLGLIE